MASAALLEMTSAEFDQETVSAALLEMASAALVEMNSAEASLQVSLAMTRPLPIGERPSRLPFRRMEVGRQSSKAQGAKHFSDA